MNKAIFYKERIKIRRFYPLAIAVLAGFTAYALLRIGRMYAFNGAASVWLAVLDRGDVLVDPLKYLPALVGAGLGLAQFLPEITQKRLKLTLHLPDSRRAMMLGMLGYGLVLLCFSPCNCSRSVSICGTSWHRNWCMPSYRRRYRGMQPVSRVICLRRGYASNPHGGSVCSTR